MNLICLALLGSIQTSTVFVSDLDLSHIRQGWGSPVQNRSVTNQPLSIAGRTFDKGLGTHAISTFKIRLDGKATRFHAFCGVDDDAGSANASVVFHVLGDGKELWKSPRLSWKQPPVEASVPLRGVKILSLVVDDAGDGIDFDHGDWAEATIEYTGAKPAALVPPIEKAVILTPPPPASPRINGPTVTGARPLHPFLYLVPATGVRPMRFSATGLPDSLTLDPSSGRITGAIAKRGTYTVALRATNRKGTATRNLKIVCGDAIALTPQMGWNSWYVWMGGVSDAIMREAADAMVANGMAQHGWQFVCIDDCWARVPGSKDPVVGGPTRDAQGRILPNAKFPDMKALTTFIHGKGLKAGIYTSPGPTTCAGYEGAFGHEAVDAKTFADWGFDLLKYDWCSYKAEVPGVEGFKKPYQVMGDLLKAQSRDMVLNLCQYGMADVWKWGKEVGGHSWRTAGDLGIGFTLFQDSFDLYARQHLDRYAGPGAFNDPDYLLLGQIAGSGGKRKTPFTPNEQYTQMSMWCLLAAPLILSGDITTLDPFTLSLLTNDEVIAVDQDALVKAAHRIAKVGETEVWAKPLEDGGLAVGLFNLGEEEGPVRVAWKDLGISGGKRVRDLWRQKELGTFAVSFEAKVPRHGVVLVKVR
ncbi:MAG: NPCBM/NEW2 domain-containing protein [Fimbriimonadaceae bacterium]|nr:NPCBM/NEW2 domain-containing protein [Chthonomonadaceae bacterium]MCO5296261.1 NPCBM/NEW2 domain-containing protein [Fimbriimonadaceae bacterium]